MPSDIDEVKEIIVKSGNSFHCKVLKHLKGNDWSILISPYYNDKLSGKPREIDLIAEKSYKIPDPYGRNPGEVLVRLFIECKFIPQKTVFWFYEKNVEQSRLLVERSSPCRLDNIYTKDHHYLLDPRVAKLFADEKSKAADNEIFFKALNQSLNSIIYYRNNKSFLTALPPKYDYIKYVLNYPVIACNSFDNLYSVNIDSDDDPSAIQSNFQLEVTYAHTGQNSKDSNEFFLLDIVDFNRFDGFLEVIKKDAELAGFFLCQS